MPESALIAAIDDPEACEKTPLTIFDPTAPLVPTGANQSRLSLVSQKGQYRRRAEILCTIRRLLIEGGYSGVTIRRISEMSGYAVQTIYNLLGSRHEAILEAISEYPQFLAYVYNPNCEDPEAIIRTIDWQMEAIAHAPVFCQRVCELYYTPARPIYYQFRSRQERSVYSLLVAQKRLGIINQGADCKDLAENLILLASSLYIEWTDGQFSRERLYQRLKSGYAYILAGVINSNIAVQRRSS